MEKYGSILDLLPTKHCLNSTKETLLSLWYLYSKQICLKDFSKLFIKDYFSKCERYQLRICLHLL